MKGDFSRLRFSPNKNYTSVLEQQGRVSLDADANEQCAINDYLRTTETLDVVGPVGGPVNDEGFKISVVGDGIAIGKGRYYVEGILCENEQALAYADQPYLLNPNPTGPELFAGLREGKISVVQFYLQVWRRLVTALDDPCLREPALGLADTTARLQTVWRVVAHAVEPAANTPSAPTGLQVTNAAEFTAVPLQRAMVKAPSTPASDVSTPATGLEVNPIDVYVEGTCCDSMVTGLLPVRDPGTMSAQTSGGSGNCTCEPTPAAGYRGLENQLYRVEIHQGGAAAAATFKWSRENGSVVVAVTGVSGSQVYVDSLGPDANLGFAVGQWVEISDDTNLFGQPPNQPGDLYQITNVTPETLSVTLSRPVASVDPTRNARMRRWDQFGSSATSNGISLSEGLWLDLENGIQVQFSRGEYVSGDYWLIPARTATGSIEWPPCNSDGIDFQPAHRIEIFYAPLACIQWDSQKQAPDVQDCRKKFYPLTGLSPAASGSCCTCRVGDGVESFGDFTSIQAAVDSLPAEGGEVCILPGRYYEHVVILNRRDIVIHGCGWQTRVASPSLQAQSSDPLVADQKVAMAATGATNPIAAVFTIADSQHIELRSFTVEAADGEAGILVDGTGTSLSTSQTAALANAAVRLNGVVDTTIKEMAFTASTLPAVLAERARSLRIDRNRVAMKNVRSLWPAIYASGIEIHIDHNWVGIQSAANVVEWLPYTVSEDLSSAPSSGAAAGAAIGANLTSTILVEVAQHPGGIQIGGPSTDVYILNNEIEGGSRNGITLGSLDVLDSTGNNTGQWTGVLITGENDCCGTGTLETSGTFPGATGDTVVAGGILTNIQIQGNRIRNMGLCGIGPVAYFNLLETLEIITISGLNISANAISRTVLREVADTVSGTTLLGYGAISVPDVQNLIILDNTITDFGAQPGVSVGGIVVVHGEMIEISRNQVIETRDWNNATVGKGTSSGGVRGGIYILLGTPPAISQPLDSSLWGYTDVAGAANTLSTPIYEPGLPAVRVEHNVVRVPLSYALAILGLGPFAVVNNHLSCGGLVAAPTSRALAQTVLILNLGSAIESSTASTLPSGFYANAQAGGMSTAAASFQNVSCGAVNFSNNLCQLEATASRQTEDASVFIFTPDHLIFSNNHCWLDTTRVSAIFDALLVAGSLNVVGNRFQEAPKSVIFSALTLGGINITGQNISTFCILVLGALRSDNNNIALIDGANAEICGALEKELLALL